MARRVPSSKALALFGVLASAASLAGGPARADEAPASIREVMRIEADVWSPRQPKQSIFDDTRIERLFSRDFVRLYRAAMRHPIYPGGTTPFDFDIIVQGQDSCSLDDMKIAQYEMDAPGNFHEVSFANFACFDDDGDKARRPTIHFSMVDEGGRTLIDDVLTYENGEKQHSTKVLMANIAAGHPERQYQAP